MYNMKSITISQARAKLFDLVDQVLKTDQVVWIRHRDRDSRVALVSEERLKQLESAIRALRRGGRPFKLAGSIRIPPGEDVERILSDIRREQAELFEAKLARLTAELEQE